MSIAPAIVAAPAAQWGAPGHVQIEGDLLSYGISGSRTDRSRSLDLGPLVIKAPLFKSAQVEVVAGPVDCTEIYGNNRAASRRSGIGSLATWAKIKITSGTSLSLAVRPGVFWTFSGNSHAVFVLGTPIAASFAGELGVHPADQGKEEANSNQSDRCRLRQRPAVTPNCV